MGGWRGRRLCWGMREAVHEALCYVYHLTAPREGLYRFLHGSIFPHDPPCTRRLNTRRLHTMPGDEKSRGLIPPASTWTIMKTIPRPEVAGTRAENAIRFTCPDCHAANTVVYDMPRDFFRETRDLSCKSCRKRFTVLTPGGFHGKPRVYAPPVQR
jgi:hypothetical protein